VQTDPAAQATIDLATGRLSGFLERYAPGLVSGLHLVGSAADGDFRPRRSDLDFVAVFSRTPEQGDLDALFVVHRAYGSDPTLPTLDGIWLTGADLAAGPDAAADGPATEQGQFLELARGNRNPVTWFALPDAVSIVGNLDRAALWQDRERLVGWVRENAQSYWRRWLADAARLSTPRGLAMLGRAGPMWGVLGISRLYYTAQTGKIASKSKAGEWALEAFGEQRIVREALAQRAGKGSLYGNPLHRRRDALTFVGRVIEEIAKG
jgi:hypothetical protein